MHHYHHRAFYIGVGCVVLIVVGLLSLNFPVAAGEHTYIDQCETAILMRRLWAIPLVVIGSIVLAPVVAVAALVWGCESAFGKDPVA
ncbi:MAG: hypothetical protein ACXWD3_16205 [Mycobacterium sp.]